ncbi:MAG: ABC transporter ATP-binding protein [Xanthomonadales bacterium]|nr:ABC transporter ATP-binding protein [Xanthomonadales bacterium]
MITVRGLDFTYHGAARPALRSLDFQVDQGEIFGFLGPSGAGKSTTQRILTGLLAPYTGQVRVFDRELSDWDQSFYERIGVSFELPNHFLKLTARENLSYFGALYRSPAGDLSALLDQVGLGQDIDTRVGEFSKGMMTRLGVARALLHDPELLFMDEPTAGLDPVTARLVKQLIRQQRDQGKTIFLTTHDMAAVDELCDRVAFIVDGEINVIDQPRALKLRFGSKRVRVEYGSENPGHSREFELDGLGANGDFLQLLQQNQIQTIHTLEASLDDVFVQVTGASLS